MIRGLLERMKLHKERAPVQQGETLVGDYPSSKAWLQSLMGGGGMTASPFIRDIYHDTVLTPHHEMRLCQMAYYFNSYITSSVELMRDVTMGRDFRIDSEDSYTRNFLQTWADRAHFIQAAREALEGYYITGNGYIEPLMGVTTGAPVRIEPVAHPENIWIIPQGESCQYLEQVPWSYQGSNASAVTVGYGRTAPTWRQRIRAINYGLDGLYHFKHGIGPVPMYGRSSIASSISDHKVLRELERAIAVIARYKAIPKKGINLYDVNGRPMTGSREHIIDYLNNLSDLDNPVFTGVKLDVKDLSYTGDVAHFDTLIDYLKKKVTAAFVPSFYLHGDVTNYAVAQDQKNVWYLKIEAHRDQVGTTFNQLIEDVRLAYNSAGFDLQPAWIEFGEFDYPTKEEERVLALQQWEKGAITLNEVRARLGLPELDDDVIGNAFYWELRQQAPAPAWPPPGPGENGRHNGQSKADGRHLIVRGQ